MSVFDEYDDLLDTESACEALKIGKNTLYDLLASKALKGYRIGRTWKIPKQAIIAFITTRANL